MEMSLKVGCLPGASWEAAVHILDGSRKKMGVKNNKSMGVKNNIAAWRSVMTKQPLRLQMWINV